MAKKTISEEDFEDYNLMLDDSYEDQEALNNMFGHVFDNARHQMQTALELTKLILDKTAQTNINQDHIFKIYQQSLSIVVESSPVQELLEKLG